MKIIVTFSLGTITFDSLDKFNSWLKITIDNFPNFTFNVEISSLN